jgi:2-polyprenyl-3-methyl-5-hydroxy-6-metoxy-1,4-benzoquinol methylase
MRLPLSKHPDQPVVRPKARLSKRETAQLKYDELWKREPFQFHPEATLSSAKRFAYESTLLNNLSCQKAVDLGAGYGEHTKLLHERGIHVDAVDISENALNQLRFLPESQRIHAYIPYTPLQDGHYDLVLALDLLAHIPQDEQRLCVSEIARLASSDGIIMLSTDLDIYTDEALAKFLYLAGTEIQIHEVHLFHHGIAIRLIDLFGHFPSLQKWLSKKVRLADFLEKIAKFYQTESEASSVIICGKKKKVPEISQSTLPHP